MHIEKWEPWFAWHPVRLKDDTRVWLKRVERHYTCGGCSLYAMCWYEYRAPADSASPSAAPQGETPAATKDFSSAAIPGETVAAAEILDRALNHFYAGEWVHIGACLDELRKLFSNTEGAGKS
jgi:hypothetical protein